MQHTTHAPKIGPAWNVLTLAPCTTCESDIQLKDQLCTQHVTSAYGSQKVSFDQPVLFSSCKLPCSPFGSIPPASADARTGYRYIPLFVFYTLDKNVPYRAAADGNAHTCLELKTHNAHTGTTKTKTELAKKKDNQCWLLTCLGFARFGEKIFKNISFEEHSSKFLQSWQC